MSEPAGPTGVLTLKQVGDMAYEQYGRILMNATGSTQITISAQDFRDLFERQTMETQIVWLGEFQSRLRGAPNSNQSSTPNPNNVAWMGGSWSSPLNTDGTQSLLNSATLSGAVSLGLITISTALPQGDLMDREGDFPNQQTLSHVSRNPTFFMRFAEGFGTGTTSAIGWHRGGESFVDLSILLEGIFVKWTKNQNLFAVCLTHSGFTQLETSFDTGVQMVDGVFHTVRMIVTGGGTAVEFVVDGVSKGSITTNIPTDTGNFALAPGFGCSNANVGQNILVDYMAMSQQRDP